MKTMKSLLALSLGALLVGCSATQQQVEAPATVQPQQTEVAQTQADKTAYFWNKRIESLINKADRAGLKAIIDVEKGIQLKGIEPHKNTLALFANGGVTEKLSNALSTVLSTYGEDVSYRYSDNYGDCCYVSHYQVVGDDMFDFDLYVDKDSGKVIDIHEKLFQYSSLEMFIGIMDLNFILADEKDYYGSFSYSNWITAVRDYQVGKATTDATIVVFNNLPENLKTKRMIFEQFIRAAVKGERNEAERSKVYSLLKAYFPKAAVLEGHYYVQKQYDQAIETLHFAGSELTDTFVMQAELSVVHLEAGNIDKALEHAFNALYKEPEDLLSYIFVLMASMKGERHDITDKTLDVIDAKWDNVIDEQWLGNFDGAKNYVGSGAFEKWQKRRSKPQ